VARSVGLANSAGAPSTTKKLATSARINKIKIPEPAAKPANTRSPCRFGSGVGFGAAEGLVAVGDVIFIKGPDLLVDEVQARRVAAPEGDPHRRRLDSQCHLMVLIAAATFVWMADESGAEPAAVAAACWPSVEVT